MPFDGIQIVELKSYFPDLSLLTDGGFEFLLISTMVLPSGCVPATVDGLLCPTPRDGYPSRLFLSQSVAHNGPGQNWNAAGVIIAGRRWWAVSWRLTIQNPSLYQILRGHLKAFEK